MRVLGTNLSVKAIGELDDEGVGIGNSGSLLDLNLIGIGAAQKDVLLNGRSEQRRLLAH